jgi:glutathione S-transferase
MAEPVLYGAAYSVYVRSCRLALAEKGVPYRLEDVHVFASEGPPPEHLTRQPFGKIPAFEHDGFMLYEAGAILRYVDEAFPGPALQPTESRARARMNQAISLCDSYLYPHGVWGVFVERVSKPKRGLAGDEDKVVASLPKAQTVCAELARFLGDQPWLCDDAISLADLHAAPMLACFSMTGEGRAALAAHPALEQWWQRLSARPSMQQTRATTDV